MSKKFIKLFTILMLISAIGTECTGGGIDLKIYAVRYGKSMFQKKFVFYGDRSGGTVPFSWMFYYIEYGDKKILVDTGFNSPEMVKAFGITDFKDPVEILEDNGIDADEITDVIITHSHFDHIGKAESFKNAHFIINKDELAELNKNKGLNYVKKFLSGNPGVTVFDESTVLYNIFTVKRIGGHTKGSSAVFFSYGDRQYCLTGDEVYLKENIAGNTGNGSFLNHGKNMEFIDQMNRGNYTLFTFHDNSYLEIKDRIIKVFPVE